MNNQQEKPECKYYPTHKRTIDQYKNLPYNWKPHTEIRNNLPESMPEEMKNDYMETAKEIRRLIKNNTSNYKLLECLLNTNFNLLTEYTY